MWNYSENFLRKLLCWAVHTCDVQLFTCSTYLQLIYQQLIWFQLDCGASYPVSQAVLINSNISLEKCIHLLEVCSETNSKLVGKHRLLIRNLQNKRRYHFQLIVVDVQEYLLAGLWKAEIWSQHNSRISSMCRKLSNHVIQCSSIKAKHLILYGLKHYLKRFLFF